ncbi:sensor histidine kinase [Salipiger mangrovisoli]|uniref:histidine kinase n=1 Tax=Salipiger mangrovisoli TaxID=2865933 RepID=A0ABR9XBS4_9RHOB|nr:PAS domain-containing protein [Salipiger mangrovisoli]MBE9640861.1 PAS domain-containing protein [Salipiger mangrovisoli]
MFDTDAAIPGTGSYEWHLDDDKLFWSRGLLELYGLKHPPDRAADFFASVHPEDRQRIREEMAEVCADADTFEHKFRIVLPDGRVRYLLDRGLVVRNAHGTAVRLSGVETDVTDVVDARIFPKGRAPEGGVVLGDAEILDAVFNDAPVGIGIWDRDLKFLKINPLLAEMNGLAPEVHIGKRAEELLPDVREIAGVAKLLQDVLDSGTARRDVEISGSTPARPSERRHWNEHFFPIRSAGRVAGIAAIVEDVTEARKAQETIDALLHELNHRSKNLVSLILAISRQTARSRPDDFLPVFQSRLESMSAAQDLLVRRSWQDIELEALVRSQLPHFAELIGNRIILRGAPDVTIPAPAAQSLALAFHELTTNAVKYGALSNETGKLTIAWQLSPDGTLLQIVWRERGGPAVSQPSRKGFGSTLTVGMLQSTLGGEIDVDYSSEGLTWSLKFKLRG